jgi:hypothetical protein
MSPLRRRRGSPAQNARPPRGLQGFFDEFADDLDPVLLGFWTSHDDV